MVSLGTIDGLSDNDDRGLESTLSCIRPKSLDTPYVPDTVAYGTMFNIQSRTQAINIITMEVIANPTGEEMDVEIYTKLGSYVGAENDEAQWVKVCHTTVIPAREGRGTLIPESDFDSFTMNPNELRAFYVTLRTSDLRYRRGDGIADGLTVASDGFLDLKLGIGLSGYGFGSAVFESRMFAGVFHYNYSTNCQAPSSLQQVAYSFNVRPKDISLTQSEINAELSRLVKESVDSILGSDLKYYQDAFDVKIQSVETFPSITADQVNGWDSCTTLDVKVTLSHLNTILGGQLQYQLLGQPETLTNNVKSGSLDVSYAGYQTLQETVLIAFRGVPNGPIDAYQKLYVEDNTATHLKEQSEGVSNAIVIGAKITKQRGPDFQHGRLRGLQAAQQENWIEFNTDVLAILTPPYSSNADFKDVIANAFNQDKDGYVEDLVSQRDFPGSLVSGSRGEYFASINGANLRFPGSEDTASDPGIGGSVHGTTTSGSNEGKKILGLNQTVFISVCLIGVALVMCWIWFACYYRRKNDDRVDHDQGQVRYIDSTGKERRRDSVVSLLKNRSVGTAKSSKQVMKLGKITEKPESVKNKKSSQRVSKSQESQLEIKQEGTTFSKQKSGHMRSQTKASAKSSSHHRTHLGERNLENSSAKLAMAGHNSTRGMIESTRSFPNTLSKSRSTRQPPESNTTSSSSAEVIESHADHAASVDEENDPDLALALRLSLEEMKKSQRKLKTKPPEADASQTRPSPPAVDSNQVLSKKSARTSSSVENVKSSNEQGLRSSRQSATQTSKRTMRESQSSRNTRTTSDSLHALSSIRLDQGTYMAVSASTRDVRNSSTAPSTGYVT